MKTLSVFGSLIFILISQVLLTNAIGQADAPPTVRAAQPMHGQLLAETPPMGWNSWDGYGTTINEEEFKANAQWLAEHLKPYGWQYVVVDEEWFVTNPVPEGNSKNSQFVMDSFGRYTPAVSRFPSAADGAGFKPLADYVHSLGLKFGIHILRGISKQSLERNLPISSSDLHAVDAADTSDTCPWNFDNYGLDPAKPGAQVITTPLRNSMPVGAWISSRLIASAVIPIKGMRFAC
jgi:hypothetical protein